MTILLDNHLSPHLIGLLAVQGHEAEHVRDHEMQTALDEAVTEPAVEHGLVLVSAETAAPPSCPDCRTLLRTGRLSTG